MKKIITAALLILTINAISCSSEDSISDGTISGYDTRECSCCGGFFIEIENVTYRFYDVPANSNLNLENPSFPIYVKLDWTKDVNACLGDEIIVLRIEER